ncbi:pilus assembly protein PilM [Candidatus Omnitrophota bacterium]
MKSKVPKDKLKTRSTQTVIEFSSHSIKLVQSCFHNKRFITNLLVGDNIGDSEYEFVTGLGKIIKDNRLKVGNLIVSLGRSLVTIRSIKLPSANEEEIKDMVQWQAAKLLPYQANEMVASYQTIKIDKDGFSHIVLVVVPKNIIRKFINVCDALKLKPQVVTLSSEGLLQWYFYLQSRNINDTLLLVDSEKNKTELVIIDHDKFIFSRSFSLVYLQNESQIKSKIIDEARLSIESYRKQETFQQIERIVLTGDKDRVSGLSKLFTDEFGLPVDVIDHLENLDFKKGMDKSRIKRDYSFASSCGLALSQKSPQVNLCPQETKDKILYLAKRRELLKTVTLALSAILVFASILGFNFYQKKKIINILDRQIEETGPAAKEIKDIKNKIAVINAQLNKSNSCIEILGEIHQITPIDINLNTFIFEESKEVVIKGTAKVMSLVFRFVPILNKSSFFEDVQVRYATQRKLVTGELTDFEIICKLSS